MGNRSRRIDYLKAAFTEATGDNGDDYAMSEDDWAFGLGEEEARELVELLAQEDDERLIRKYDGE